MWGSLSDFRRNGKSPVTASQALAISTVLTNLVRIVSTVILSRLLAPDVYGIVGLILSVFYAINLLTDVGFQAYVVRHEKSEDLDFLSAVWSIHAARGVALAVIGVSVAWPVSWVLALPELALPLAVASSTFAIDGVASLKPLRALREGRIQRFALLSFLLAIAQTFAAIALAFFIRNVWAIVGSMIFASFVRVWLSRSLFVGRNEQWRTDAHVASDLWRFAKLIVASSALTLVITQADKLALGRMLSLSDFGTYVIATSLVAAPTAFAYNYVSGIVYPAAANAWRQGNWSAATYYENWGRFFYAYALGGGALVGGSTLLIRLLYDPRYLLAGKFLAVLGIAAAMTIVTRSMQDFLVASGRTHVAVEFNLARLFWLLAGGLSAIAMNDPMILVITIGLIEVPAYLLALWRMHRLGLIRWWREASYWLVFAVGMGVALSVSLAGQQLLPRL